jgi:hypothetical protein
MAAGLRRSVAGAPYAAAARGASSAAIARRGSAGSARGRRETLVRHLRPNGKARRLCDDRCMSNYAIVNLLELDDDVKGRVDGLEGRFGRKPLGARDIGVSH